MVIFGNEIIAYAINSMANIYVSKEIENNFFFFVVSAIIMIIVGGKKLPQYREIVNKRIKEYFPNGPVFVAATSNNKNAPTPVSSITKFDPKYSNHPILKPLIQYLNAYEALFTASVVGVFVIFIGIVIVEFLRFIRVLTGEIVLEKFIINGIGFFYLTLSLIFIIYKAFLTPKNSLQSVLNNKLIGNNDKHIQIEEQPKENKNAQKFVLAIFMLMLPIGIGMLWISFIAQYKYRPVSVPNCFSKTFIIPIVPTILLLWPIYPFLSSLKLRNLPPNKFRHGIIAIMFFLFLSLSFIFFHVMLAVNVLMDHSHTQLYNLEVLTKESNYIKGSQFYDLKVKPYTTSDGINFKTISLSQEEYNLLNVGKGDSVTIGVGKGALGCPWISSIKKTSAKQR